MSRPKARSAEDRQDRSSEGVCNDEPPAKECEEGAGKNPENEGQEYTKITRKHEIVKGIDNQHGSKK